MLELIIFFLLTFIGIQEYFNRQERQKLMDRIMARSLGELSQHELVSKAEPETEIPPDYEPVEAITDEEFDQAIKQQLGRESVIDKAKRKLKRKAKKGK